MQSNICNFCERPFTNKNRSIKYCSDYCRANKVHGIPIIKKCPICSNLFITRKRRMIACSRYCKDQLRKFRAIQNYYKRRKKITEDRSKGEKRPIKKFCLTCGKEFTTIAYNKIYCQIKCQLAVHSGALLELLISGLEFDNEKVDFDNYNGRERLYRLRKRLQILKKERDERKTIKHIEKILKNNSVENLKIIRNSKEFPKIQRNSRNFI
jgi:hypothetical protein